MKKHQKKTPVPLPVPAPAEPPRKHVEQYRFADDLSIPHRKQPPILRFVSVVTGRSEYLDARIFGAGAEYPKTISITVEW